MTATGLLLPAIRQVSAQCEAAKLLASDGAAGDFFGLVALSFNGENAIVGASSHDGPANDTGAAYVYVWNGSAWEEQAELTASDGAFQDLFGAAVALSGDGNTAVVGALLDDDGGKASGSAYVFRRKAGTWTQQAKLTASDAASGDGFGSAVAVSADGQIILIAAREDDNAGSVYVFVWDGSAWVEQVKLTASDGEPGDLLGSSVAVSPDGQVALIGALRKSSDRGAAYVFVRNGSSWAQQAKLEAKDGLPGDGLGVSVAISAGADTALVGAFGDDAYRGSAYVYVRDGPSWVLQQKLVADDGVAQDRFGHAVALSADGTIAAVGAHGHAPCGETCFGAGAVYVFTRTGSVWTQELKLIASDPVTFDALGARVSISADGGIVLAGAPEESPFPGSAYVFDLAGADCNENVLCDARELVEGTATDNNGTGVLDECEGDLDGNGTIGLIDFQILLVLWGPCPAPPGPCPADLDDNGMVGIVDLLILLFNWG